MNAIKLEWQRGAKQQTVSQTIPSPRRFSIISYAAWPVWPDDVWVLIAYNFAAEETQFDRNILRRQSVVWIITKMPDFDLAEKLTAMNGLRWVDKFHRVVDKEIYKRLEWFSVIGWLTN